MALTQRPRFHIVSGADANFDPSREMASSPLAYALTQQGHPGTRIEVPATTTVGPFNFLPSGETADTYAFVAEGDFTVDVYDADDVDNLPTTITRLRGTAAAPRWTATCGSETRTGGDSVVAHRKTRFRLRNNGTAAATCVVYAAGGATVS